MPTSLHRGLIGALALLCAGWLLAAAPAATAAETRTVTDQLSRTVTVPADIQRIVVLQHQTLDILVELGAADKIVGVLRSWPSLIPGLDKYAPQLVGLPTPGDLSTANVEELLRLKPDVVFVTNYAPAAMIDQIAKAGVPVVAISLSQGEGVEAPKLNPTFADDDVAYAEGLKAGVKLIGAIVGKSERADQLLDYAFSRRAMVQQRVADLPQADRVRLYMANPDLSTYGSGKYTGVIMARSGGVNVAAGVRGATKVSMEDILAWDPQVIFVQDRYAPVADQIRQGSAWQHVDAVKAGRIYITPEYVKPWGYPLPEALALGELWMAKTLYPDRFADIDMQAEATAYYQRFYGQPYTGPN
ncbi:iron complex transport system substrate-binding protein [Inquilinus ginsengisoli]|uniref:Iron complex transport system substrate-binding protein n=1 Tax=Inquilinus ginsengisoli TaxID=363840 RepID=A0ABU1JU32_9PROT|nr:ABC transporter substrate-binding protein [Inquilinus ginsengisoli]MDR6292135.1 iron complex transport system substrate-binding protein [Inquilinus ginsengisoli]